MKINDKLAKAAKQAGICDEWYGKIKAGVNNRQLADLYISGLKFCLERNYPDKEIIKEHFGDIAHDYGVYVDEWIELANVKKVVALGDSSGNIVCDKFNVGDIYVANDSELNIRLKDHSITRIDIYDDAVVNIDISDEARVWINEHNSNELHITKNGNPQIKIIDKTNKN